MAGEASLLDRQLGYLRKALVNSGEVLRDKLFRPAEIAWVQSATSTEGVSPKDLRNLYQRVNYNLLREEGMSREQARRFSWQTPESAEMVKDRMVSVVETFTAGALKAKAASALERGQTYDMDANYETMRDKVKRGLARSKRSIESWEVGETQ